jgi:glycosyltransferase involved in cell wall biosynthesis
MRAFHVLRALAVTHDVHLVVGNPLFPCTRADLARADLPVASRLALPLDPAHAPDLFLRRVLHRCLPQRLGHRARHPWYWSSAAGGVRRVLRRFVEGKPITTLHVFRLYMLPVGEAALALLPRAPLQIDLDDIESDTCTRLADLHRRVGDLAAAAAAQRDADFYSACEARYLPRVGKVWVCSEPDRAKLSARLGCGNIATVPNTVPIPDAPLPPPTDDPFTLLFVGSLGYLPNRSGVDWFLGEVLPRLAGLATRPLRFRVVGHLPAGYLPPRPTGNAAVELIGHAPAVRPHYAVSAAAAVPLFAGGGTRVKLLEAFSFQRPVVTTSMGAEGLDVNDGEHVLLADDAPRFARQCWRLMQEPELGALLAKNAWRLLHERYHPDLVAAEVQRHTLRPEAS